MSTKIIRTEDQYHAYLGEVEGLMARGERLTSAEVDRLEVLTVLVESYENGKYPIEPLDPVDAILFRMEEKGLKQADLIPYLEKKEASDGANDSCHLTGAWYFG
jgi:HTH-type transcriptional regulator/antitoxin HigA